VPILTGWSCDSPPREEAPGARVDVKTLWVVSSSLEVSELQLQVPWGSEVTDLLTCVCVFDGTLVVHICD